MPTEYTTARFRLRSIEDRDLPALLRNFSDPELMKFYDLAPVTNLDEMRELVARWRRWEARGTGVRWTIALKETDEAIGTCGFRDIDLRVRCAEAGCELRPEYWRRGVIQEVAPLVGRHAFEVLALRHLKAFIAQGNEASIGLMRKFGFRRRGLVRGRAIVNGERRDMLYFTMSRATYRAKVHPDQAGAFDELLFEVREFLTRIALRLGPRALRHRRSRHAAL